MDPHECSESYSFFRPWSLSQKLEVDCWVTEMQKACLSFCASVSLTLMRLDYSIPSVHWLVLIFILLCF